MPLAWWKNKQQLTTNNSQRPRSVDINGSDIVNYISGCTVDRVHV